MRSFQKPVRPQSRNHTTFVVVDRAIAVLGGVDWTVARWELPSHPLFDPDSSVHQGLELSVNGRRFRKSISEYWESPHLDLTDERGEAPCPLWQDVAVCVRGEAAADVASNFRERWERARASAGECVSFDPLLKGGRPSPSTMPRIPDDLVVVDDGSAGGPGEEGRSVIEADISASPRPLCPGGFASESAASSCRCQIVRSLSRWSGTDGTTDISHCEAWISAINGAREFIYIEQQVRNERLAYFVVCDSSCRRPSISCAALVFPMPRIEWPRRY